MDASPTEGLRLDDHGHSTLEVVTDEHLIRQGRYPEVVPPQHQPETYGYYAPSKIGPTARTAGPEIPSTSHTYSTYPEVADGTHLQSAVVSSGSKKATICGIRRKYFWLALVAAIVVIIAVVVGATVGALNSRAAVSRSKESGGQSAGPSAGDNSGDNSGDGPAKLSLFEDTRLATANFTDAYGNDNFLLIYQLNDSSIRMSAFNSSNNKWVVSTVVNNTSDVKLGTSLSLNTYWQGSNSPDVYIYYQSSGSVTTIESLEYNSKLNLSTQSVTPSDNWAPSNALSQYNLLPDSSLVAYGRQCEYCNQFSYLFWQGPTGISMAELGAGAADSTEVIPVSATPSANTSIALTYSGTLTGDSEAILRRSLDIFYRSTTSGLVQVRIGNNAYLSQYVGRTVGPRTQFAAFSTGFNESDSHNPTPLGFQVLSIDPDADDGVQLTYFQESAWKATSDAVGDLAGCLAKATMAVNTGRRLYCLVEVMGSKGVEIMEWAWKGDPSDTSTYMNWDKVGVVDVGV